MEWNYSMLLELLGFSTLNRPCFMGHSYSTLLKLYIRNHSSTEI